MFNAQTRIANEISKIKLPFITVHGTSDQMVNIASSQFLFDNAQSEDKTFEVLNNNDDSIIHITLLLKDFSKGCSGQKILFTVN